MCRLSFCLKVNHLDTLPKLPKLTLSSPEIQSESHSLNNRNALAAVYTDILHSCGSKFTQTWFKVCTIVLQGTCVFYCGPIIQVNGNVHAKPGCHWLCLAGDCSRQGLFCTKLSKHGILVIKTRWSLNTWKVNGRFYCTYRRCQNKVLVGSVDVQR